MIKCDCCGHVFDGSYVFHKTYGYYCFDCDLILIKERGPERYKILESQGPVHYRFPGATGCYSPNDMMPEPIYQDIICIRDKIKLSHWKSYSIVDDIDYGSNLLWLNSSFAPYPIIWPANNTRYWIFEKFESKLPRLEEEPW